MYSAHDFSIFCPLDSVAPAQAGKLADYSWVELQSPPKAQGRKPSVSTMPYYGPGWYQRVDVEFMLHRGLHLGGHLLEPAGYRAHPSHLPS